MPSIMVQHGTRNCYNSGCRCPMCSVANSEYHKTRRKQEQRSNQACSLCGNTACVMRNGGKWICRPCRREKRWLRPARPVQDQWYINWLDMRRIALELGGPEGNLKSTWGLPCRLITRDGRCLSSRGTAWAAMPSV